MWIFGKRVGRGQSPEQRLTSNNGYPRELLFKRPSSTLSEADEAIVAGLLSWGEEDMSSKDDPRVFTREEE